MDEGNYADYFLQPKQSPQRRYEALREAELDKGSPKTPWLANHKLEFVFS